jgi:hypothetical protein
MQSAKDLSKRMSESLDILGFHHERIQERIRFYEKLSRAQELSAKLILKNDNIEEVIAGSSIEGIGMRYCNDLDILRINHSVICCNSNYIERNDKVIFKMEQKGAPKGYTYLKLMFKDTDSKTYESLKYALLNRKKGKYLSSTLFMTKNENILIKDSFLYKMTHFKTPHGPSIPTYFKHFFDEEDLLPSMKLTDKGMDFVRAYPCEADEILNAWKNMDRKCGWPNQETIAHVMSLPVYVVPVGQKGSINEDLQWRISFTMAETYLIQALNSTQKKVFVLMKLATKYILQPLCDGITSYVVKTVILWLSENIPKKKFCKKNLLSRLMNALAFLKTAVENKNLPSYLMPGKNLLENKITRVEQHLLLRKLTYLQDHGLKLVNEFFNGWCPYNREIEEISLTIYNANLIFLLTLCFSCNTSEELACLFTEISACKSWRYMYLYTVVFVAISFNIKYGENYISLKRMTRKRKAQTKEGEKKKLKTLHY